MDLGELVDLLHQVDVENLADLMYLLTLLEFVDLECFGSLFCSVAVVVGIVFD